ncbi:unnamed protein product [Arctia plantaginis]|uniref:Uncharacterized protein n=1 Tax=Arctia plantaginis TaxID=874455 RepID=A0A8S0Z1N2_ARCPL|nr:unnamed protein product [Arctia plantaginis]
MRYRKVGKIGTSAASRHIHRRSARRKRRSKRRRKNKAKTHAEHSNALRNDVQEVTVVTATKANEDEAVNLDTRLTRVIGTFQKVLVALLEMRVE